MDNLIPQGGPFWATIGASSLMFTGLMYKVYRMVKGDLRDDKTVQNVDKFVETQTAKIKDLEDQNRQLNERIDTLQKERATAMALSGQLQGNLEGLKFINESLKEQKEQKDKEIENLKQEVIKLKSQNENLLKLSTFLKPDSYTNQRLNGDTTNG